MVRGPEKGRLLLPVQGVRPPGQGLFHDPVPGSLPGRSSPPEPEQQGRVEAVDQGIHHRPEKTLFPGEEEGEVGLRPQEIVLQGLQFGGQLHLLGDEEEPRFPEQPSHTGPSGDDGDGD